MDLPPSVDNGFGEAVLLGTFLFNACPTVLAPKVAAAKLGSKLPTFNPAITFAPPNVKVMEDPQQMHN